MERPKGLDLRVAAGIIVLFHTVGLVGLLVPAYQSAFLRVVPFHLMLMFVVIVLSHQSVNLKYLLFFCIVYLLGFTAEWIGVHKNWIFGNYAYGNTLGTKAFDIPLTIGINWFLLVYAAGVTMQLTRIKSVIARVILGALILVALDFLIEPVAMRFDYWQWTKHTVPFKNYLGWFMMSVLMLGIFERFKFPKQTWVAPLLLCVQFVFFGILANTDIGM